MPPVTSRPSIAQFGPQAAQMPFAQFGNPRPQSLMPSPATPSTGGGGGGDDSGGGGGGGNPWDNLPVAWTDIFPPFDINSDIWGMTGQFPQMQWGNLPLSAGEWKGLMG